MTVWKSSSRAITLPPQPPRQAGLALLFTAHPVWRKIAGQQLSKPLGRTGGAGGRGGGQFGAGALLWISSPISFSTFFGHQPGDGRLQSAAHTGPGRRPYAAAWAGTVLRPPPGSKVVCFSFVCGVGGPVGVGPLDVAAASRPSGSAGDAAACRGGVF